MILAPYFKLIRWKNLSLILYIFLLFRFVFFNSLSVETTLSSFQFLALLLSVLLITSAGYIINDIYDIKADVINKPSKLIVSQNISIETAKQWYKITNAFGLILGIALCLQIGKPTYSFVFIGTTLLLYYYAKKLKSLPLIGNLVVSFLTAVSVLILPFFDIDFSVKNSNQNLAIGIILWLAVFSFSLNLIREIVKDIEDVNGDYHLNMRTLPILIGRFRTRNIASISCLIPISLLVYTIINYSTIYKFTAFYLLIFTLIPLLYIALKLKSAKKKSDFSKLSSLLKIIMFLGINSVLIFSIIH